MFHREKLLKTSGVNLDSTLWTSRGGFSAWRRQKNFAVPQYLADCGDYNMYPPVQERTFFWKQLFKIVVTSCILVHNEHISKSAMIINFK